MKLTHIFLAMIALVAVPAQAGESQDASQACQVAMKKLEQKDPRVSGIAEMCDQNTRSVAYWNCVTAALDVGEKYAYASQQCSKAHP